MSDDDKVTVIAFTTEADMEEVQLDVPWPVGMVQSVWLQKAGFELAQEIGEMSHYGTRLRIHYADGEGPWYALVEVDDNLDGDAELLVVRDRIALVRLRIYLGGRIAFGAIERLDELCTLAKRAFEAWHGHPFSFPCKRCDRDEHELERLALEKTASPSVRRD